MNIQRLREQNIQNGKPINSDDVNAEFDQLIRALNEKDKEIASLTYRVQKLEELTATFAPLTTQR